MSKSLIQLYNESTQAVTQNNVINLGSVLRRYGCNLKLSGGAVEIDGPGYYEANVIATVEPTAVGNVTVALFENNVQIEKYYESFIFIFPNGQITIRALMTPAHVFRPHYIAYINGAAMDIFFEGIVNIAPWLKKNWDNLVKGA